jgi:hypothetical protein
VRRLGIIYDTNLRTSYSEGGWRQIQRIRNRRPYLRYYDPDPNPRPMHLEWSGTVVRADSEWAAAHNPPNGWNCKCYWDTLDAEDVAERGLQVSDPPVRYREHVNPRTGAASRVPEGVDPSFAYPPGSANEAVDAALEEKLATADPDIARAVRAMKAPEDAEPSPVRDALTYSRATRLETRRTLRSAWKKLPDRLRRMLEDAGVGVHLSRRRLDDLNLSGAPRGWRPSSTQDSPPGLYIPRSRLISLVTETRSPDGTYEPVSRSLLADALRHEIGHALYRLSDTASFRAAHEADLRAGAASRTPNPYYLQEGNAGLSEVFAGLVAAALGSPDPSLQAAFPRSSEAVGLLLKTLE